MAIDPIKIPQNVYIEDRIVGPLTLKQIMTVGIGCGFSYAIWASASKAYGAVGIIPTVLIWTPGIVSVVFAFVKINDLSMLKLVFLSIERAMKAPTRTWSPRRGITVNIRTFSNAQDNEHQKEMLKAAMAAKKTNQLDAISSVLDRAMDPAQDEPTIGEYGDSVAQGTVPGSSGRAEAPGMSDAPAESKFAGVVPIKSTAVVAAGPQAAPAEANVDGVSAPRAHSSIFRDISPAK